MHKLPHLFPSRHGVYYLRLARGGQEVKRSLRTKNFRQARLLTLAFNLELAMQTPDRSNGSTASFRTARRSGQQLPPHLHQPDACAEHAPRNAHGARRALRPSESRFQFASLRVRQRCPLRPVLRCLPLRTAKARSKDRAFVISEPEQYGRHPASRRASRPPSPHIDTYASWHKRVAAPTCPTCQPAPCAGTSTYAMASACSAACTAGRFPTRAVYADNAGHRPRSIEKNLHQPSTVNR